MIHMIQELFGQTLRGPPRLRCLDERQLSGLSPALCGIWAADRYAWRRSRIIKLREPVPYRGRQGLFEIPDAIVPSLSLALGDDA
jgi:hypothetical protein